MAAPLDAFNVQPLMLEEDLVLRKNRQFFKRGCCIAMAVVLVAVLVKVMGVIFAPRRNNAAPVGGGSGGQDGVESQQGQAPTMMPTFAPATDRTWEVMAYLMGKGVSSGEGMETLGSPQNLAARWLGQRDVMALSVPSSSST